VPIATNDGVDASYHLDFGDASNSVVATYGKHNSELPNGGTSEARRQWAITDTVEYGRATAYVTYHEAHFTLTSLDSFFDAFRQFGPQGNAIADKYDPYNKLVTFFGLGGAYDPSNWFVMGEWATTDFRSVIGKSTGWYVSGGYRVAKFTPYLTYGAVKVDSNTSDPGINTTALPPFLVGPADGLNAGLNAILGSIPAQRTMSVGARWDFVNDFDLKLQLDHTRLAAGSPGTLSNLQPDFQPGGTLNLISIAIDFVW
jgi:hypothetical protein